MNLCMSMGSRENKQNKVRTQLWDTLYFLKSFHCPCGRDQNNPDQPMFKEDLMKPGDNMDYINGESGSHFPKVAGLRWGHKG